jgi:hypothetical protein
MTAHVDGQGRRPHILLRIGAALRSARATVEAAPLPAVTATVDGIPTSLPDATAPNTLLSR